MKLKSVYRPGDKVTVANAPAPRIRGHQMVVQLAARMANEIYEENAKNNAWYKQYPSRKDYVIRATPLLCEDARATLAAMLTSIYPAHLKEQIKDALILDNQFRRRRNV